MSVAILAQTIVAQGPLWVSLLGNVVGEREGGMGREWDLLKQWFIGSVCLKGCLPQVHDSEDGRRWSSSAEWLAVFGRQRWAERGWKRQELEGPGISRPDEVEGDGESACWGQWAGGASCTHQERYFQVGQEHNETGRSSQGGADAVIPAKENQLASEDGKQTKTKKHIRTRLHKFYSPLCVVVLGLREFEERSPS